MTISQIIFFIKMQLNSVPQISFIQWKMMFMYLLIVYLVFVFILYFYVNKKEVIIFKMDNNLSYCLKW